MNFEKGVLFDPGYSEFTYSFSQNAISVEEIMSQIKPLHQKKFQYKIFFPKIVMVMHNSVAFYLGCLLWANYIVCKFKNSPKQILNNPYAGKEISDSELFYEIDFMLDYFEKIRKDSQYFLAKPYTFPQEWKDILVIYKKFLKLNGSFSSALTTADIKLPDEIKTLSDSECDEVLNQIEAVLSSGRLEDLFSVKEKCI